MPLAMQRQIKSVCQAPKILMTNTVLFKTLFILLSLCSAGSYCFAQKTELRLNAYSGVFFFRGNGSTTYSTVHVSDDIGYFNPMPYGRKSSFSYAFEFQVQRVTKQKHLFGMGISFERLKSRAVVDSTSYTFVGYQQGSGHVTLANTFMTLNPYIGQRFIANKFTFDIMAGIDFAISTKVHEEAKVTSDNDATYNKSKSNYPVDFRPRLQINASYNRIGILAGYSIGLRNLYSYPNPFFSDKKAYSNFLRLGMSYRLK